SWDSGTSYMALRRCFSRSCSLYVEGLFLRARPCCPGGKERRSITRAALGVRAMPRAREILTFGPAAIVILCPRDARFRRDAQKPVDRVRRGVRSGEPGTPFWGALKRNSPRFAFQRALSTPDPAPSV